MNPYASSRGRPPLARRPAGRRRRLAEGAQLLLLAGGPGDAAGEAGVPGSPGGPDVRVSTVGGNGMPRDVVPRGADWNFGPGGVWTHGGWQYAAYWDDACQVSVARRRLPSGAWSVVSLPGYRRTGHLDRGKGGPISRGFGDGHEKVAMGIAPDGVIHLAFDHHLSTLHYRASRGPVADDPEAHAWRADLFGPVQDNLGGPVIESVTYPSFVVDGERLVLYLRLNGGSGSADSHFFEYAGGRWRVNDPREAKVIDKHWSGGNGTVCAYPHVLVARGGRRHLTWCWRDTPDERTSHDLCYAYSEDQGRTWLNNDGRRIGVTGETFITADSPGVAVVSIPPGTRYRNGGSMTVDGDGRVHVLMRGEQGQPVHFRRDPVTGRWSREEAAMPGRLVMGRGDDLLVVNEEGVHRLSARRPGRLHTVVRGVPDHFANSSLRTDPMRAAHDGWISVIGQQGTTVRVVDYWTGHPGAPARTGSPP